jgi:ubiquitin carboxyl-terminal hydrolase 14
LKCDEAPEEPATVSTENVLKVGCHISMQTNFMHSGIKEVSGAFGLAFISFPNHDLQALDQKVTKRSPTLDRDAVYSHRSRLERLPTYLTVHMVRFAWREDIGKKAKIMVRKHRSRCAYNVDLLYFSSVK